MKKQSNWSSTAYAMVVIAAVAIVGVAPARAGLIAFYDFEDDVDDTVSGFDGTVSGTTAFSATVPAAIAGRSTKSFSFDGSSFVSLPHASIDFYDRAQSTGASISLWARIATQDEKYFFSEGNSGNNTPIYGFQTGDTGGGTGDQIRFVHRPTDSSPFTLVPSNGSYFTGTAAYDHIVMTDDAGEVTIYVNGVADTADFDYTPEATALDRTAIGALYRATTGFYLTGQVDEAAVFDHVLSTSEVSQLLAGVSPTSLGQEIPEPATMCALGLAVAGLGGYVRKRRRA